MIEDIINNKQIKFMLNHCAEVARYEKNSYLKNISIVSQIFWYLIPGYKIHVKWPKHGWHTIHTAPDGNKVDVETNDPNVVYRPLLEDMVGTLVSLKWL
jgi:hypothetical protein